MNFTEDQLVEIAAKAKKIGIYNDQREQLIKALSAPAIEFAEGELLVDLYKEGSCLTVRANDCMKYINYRAQTQPEHGPAVADLVEAIKFVKAQIAGREWVVLADALDAYNARHPK